MAAEERKPFRREELEGRVPEPLIPAAAAEVPIHLRREIFRDPELEGLLRVKALRQRRHLVLRQVRDDTLGEDEGLARLGPEPRERVLALAEIREIEGDALELHPRRLPAEGSLLVRDHARVVDLDPAE